MDPEKAIEILKELTRFDYNPTNPDAEDALKMGIEALKREKGNRERRDIILVGKLPGENVIE